MIWAFINLLGFCFVFLRRLFKSNGGDDGCSNLYTYHSITIFPDLVGFLLTVGFSVMGLKSLLRTC
ncbi:hypothetical protein ACE6H2_016116 [Prunus campanulata]